MSCSQSQNQNQDHPPEGRTDGRCRLPQVQFIPQETADRILQYRDKKGGFRSLRQLAKVRGVSRRSADVLRHYFSLDDASEQESSSSEKTSVTAPAEMGPPTAGPPLGHRRTHSVPLGLGAAGPFLEASGDICELLALHSPRPVLEEVRRPRQWDRREAVSCICTGSLSFQRKTAPRTENRSRGASAR